MDHDDNDTQDQNLHLAGEEISKVSPVLRLYALPKFDFGDSLPGNLRFDSLVENEVFLGISSQEDSQWIEEYSRGTRAIQFSSSVAESRHKNVWSEATSSESVEMLLKSVGQEEKVVEETIIEELYACDKPGSLTDVMDPNLKQCDQKDAIVSDEFQENFVGSKVSSDCEQSHARFTSQSQEAQISGGELDSVVIGEKYSLPVAEKKVDNICDDINQEEASNLVNQPFDNEFQEQNVDARIEELKCQENPQEVPERSIENSSVFSKNFSSSEAEHIIKSKEKDNLSHSDTIVETCTYSEEKLSIVSNVVSRDKPSVEVSIPVDEEPTDSLPKESRDMHIVEGNNLSEMGEGSDVTNIGTSLRSVCSSAELAAEDVSNKDVVAQDDALKVHAGDSNDEDPSLPANFYGLVQVGDETRSTESGAIPMDQDVTVNERGDAKLPSNSGDMDVEVVGAPDSQKNVEPSSSADVCKGVMVMAQGSESIMAVRADTVAAVESSKISSPDTPDGVHIPSGSVATAEIVTEDRPKSPMLGVSLLPDDNEEKAEVGISSVGSPEKGTQIVESMLDCASDGPSSVIGIGAVSDRAGKVVHGTAGHCDPPVENCNVSPNEQAAEDNPGGVESSKAMETSHLLLDSSTQEGNNGELGQLDRKGSMTGQHRAEPQNIAVNMSDEQQATVDVAGPSECDDNHIMQDGGSSASMDKSQILSHTDTNSIELSQSTKDNHEAAKGSMINDMKGKVQPVSPSSATKEEKNITFEVTASASHGKTSVQDLSLAKVSSINSSGSLLDPNKLREVSLDSPQTPSSAATQGGAKGNFERKPRRKSAGTETTSGRRSGRVEKSPALLTTSAVRHVIPSEELKPNESVESSNPKPSGILPVPTLNLPDLYNSTSIFQQTFTDNHQVQLRAQILVYGSLIAGMPPEEPHMIAAFGQSVTDGGRRVWEAAWHTYLERVNGHKSPANNPDTPLRSRSVLEDVGNKDPDQGIKISSAQSKILLPPTVGPSNTGTSSPVISSMIPISSPLWNISTPCDILLDYRQVLSPLWVQNFAGHNPSWLSQGPLSGQWVASSPVSAFNAHFSALPITESVKLSTVKESGAPGISAIPVDHSPGPSIFSGSSSISNMKNSTVPLGQPSSDSKSRKRKKVATSQAQASSPSTPVVHLPRAPHTQDYNQISFLAQNQTDSGFPTPASIMSNSNPGGFISAKVVTSEDNLSKVEKLKRQADDAARHATAAISHCQGVWSQLERQKSSDLVSDDETKLVSSAVSIAAAASVAKVAAAAAIIASNVAEQARLMAEEVFLSSRTENLDQSSKFDKAADRSNHPSSIISAAREAACRRIEAASAASKQAENLDAIVKAAELAAEAVSQAGKIVSMGNPLSVRDLVEAGPEGYWKTPQLSNQTDSSDKKNLEHAPNGKEIQTRQEDSGNLAENQMVINDKNDKMTSSAFKGPNLSKTVEPESGSIHPSVLDQNMPESTSGTWKENGIKEGCLVEVYKDDNKHKSAWLAANVLSLKDGKAFVVYTEIQSDEGSGHLKEWVPLEVKGTETPRIRIAHPVTTMRFERTRKRRRTAVTDYAWSSGDRVDVWVQDCWREGVVKETNKIGVTSLTVQFPAQGETLVVRSWHVRPTLIWKNEKWIHWSSLKGCRSSEGDAPPEKRPKLGSPIVEGKEKDKSSKNVDLVESGRHVESRTLPVSFQEGSFEIGKSYWDENKLKTHKTMKSGLQKEGLGVVFGVPKPGKKQKFKDVSNVADGNNTNNTPNDSAKLASYLIPRGSKNNSTNDAKEKHVVETKSKVVKSQKPPIPLFRTKDKSKSCKPTSHDALMIDKTVKDHQNWMKFESSSNTEDAPKEVLMAKPASQHLKKGKAVSGGGKTSKVEGKDKSSSEIGKTRRSNRRIQPTSRLLEGLQSSLNISKTPAVSHTSQRSHNKVTSKGNTNHG